MCPFAVRATRGLTLSGFSREPVYMLYRVTPGGSPYCQVRLGVWICLYSSASTPFNRLFRQSAALSLLRPRFAPQVGTGILTCSAIGYAVRLLLRSRLTQIRLALIRKPWSCGGQVSRLPYRYLYLHLLFQTLQQVSQLVFYAVWNAPLPMITHPAASAGRLCPSIIHAAFLD